MAERPQFYLIDGHAVAYRQFFALKSGNFTTRAGEPTNATYGFTRILLDILQNDMPRYLAVTFDKGLSGREELFPDYKGTREKMPDDLSTQLDRIEELVKAFNIPILALDGYEADDVIGTVAPVAEAQGVDVRIITGDKDILQLLTPHIQVQLPKRGEDDVIWDIAAFKEKYSGLEPEKLVDLKALMGDSSDNIPGVKGIGEKGGLNLLVQYGSLDNIYAHLDEITGATHNKLVEGKEMAYISQKLARILRDVPIELNLEACVAHDFDKDVVLELFRVLEFRTFSKRISGVDTLNDEADEDATDSLDEVKTIIVQDEVALNKLVAVLNKAKAITWDVETTSIDQMSAELVGIALSVDGKTGYYVPVGHKGKEELPLFATADSGQPGQQLPMKTVIDALRPPLTNPNIPKIAHNAVYDLVVMQRYGIDVSPVGFDTMVAEWMIDPLSKYLGLKSLVNQRLKIQMTEIKELIGTGKNQVTMDRVEIADAAPYAAADAALTHRLVSQLEAGMAEVGVRALFDTLEMPLVPILADMQRTGVVLDVAFLRDLSKRLDSMLREYEREIYALTGGNGEFNINSPKQLNDVLFGKLNLPVAGLKKTTHGYSTDVTTLDALKDEHPIIEHILNYREVAKLQSTYVDALPQLVNAETGRVHTSYNQAGASTGRMSSSNPNLQNIPIRTELGREVRRAFVSAPGHVLLAVDYSQIELRVLAHVCKDKTLLEAFAHNQDIHRATAAAVNDISVEQVTSDQRSFAKRVNFGLIYGMGAFRLARDSEMSVGEARDFIARYFARLPGVEQYIEGTKKLAREQGYVTTLFGRRGSFEALKTLGENSQRAAGLERAAINMPIQGTAADIMKKAMLDVYHELKRQDKRAKMILQVHDELVLEVPEDECDSVTRLVIDVMEATYQMDAPLVANAQVGTNWRDMTDVDRH